MSNFSREQEAAAERLALQYDSVKVGSAGPAHPGSARAECFDLGELVAVYIINTAGETRGE